MAASCTCPRSTTKPTCPGRPDRGAGRQRRALRHLDGARAGHAAAAPPSLREPARPRRHAACWRGAVAELWAALRDRTAARRRRAGRAPARPRERRRAQAASAAAPPSRPSRPSPPPAAAASSCSGGLAPSRAHGSSNSTRHLPSSPCCEREPRAERLARAALEARHRPRRAARGDQLACATACGSVLPALLFQITKPQPGSSRDQHEKPLRFSTMSWPQTGHGPRLARGMRTSLSLRVELAHGPARELGDVAP